jgi:WD40 repeat protein/tRNA A-37 threonylcarbamoyl transferase component Bud32
MLEPGAILQDRYKIIAPTGKGGMGSVYKARDLRLRTDVALKETLFNDDVYRRAFEHEAQILARLRHQALPRVIDHFIEGQGQFLVMEFIHGEDLGNQLVRLGQRFATPQAMPMILRWADQLLDALHYLHTRQMPVIHRDIKPKNLKLTPTYDIILLDFGLARGGMTVAYTPDSDGSDQRKIYGFTPPYAPIEQMRDGEPDARSDLYSLAATVYHLLTATLPPDAMTRMARMINGQPDPLKPVRALAPHVPEAVDNLLQQALAVMLDGRPATARVMRTELARARGVRSEAAPPPAPLDTAPAATSPNPRASPEVAPPASPVEGLAPGAMPFPGSITPNVTQPGATPGATALGTLLRMLTTGSPIRSLSFSPTGALLAAGYDDHTVGVWRLSDFSHVMTLKGHSSAVRAVRFAPQGGLLVTGGDDETVRLWQVADGTPLRRLHVPGCPVESIAFSPDGTQLAVGGWGSAITICGIDGERLSVVGSLASPFVHSLGFSPDGRLLAAGGYDGAIYLWSVADQETLETLAAFPTFILALAFSPDGAYLAASSNTSVRIYRMSDHRPIEQLQGHSGPIHAIAFSPDSRMLATGSEDKSVRLWRVSDGVMVPIPLEHRGGVASLCYSPDGSTLATGSHDGRICLWTVGV